MSTADLMMLDSSFGKPRAILWSEQMIRVSIDNSGASQAVIAAFASETDGADRILRPKASGVAFTVPGGYILGPNPPPMGGDFAIPGTFGLVDAASGEFRHSTVDIELPSRRMPIRFERTVNNQDTCHSAFGNGWDFFYNQRLIELKADKILPGNMLPSIPRKDMDSSVIAEASDVEFRDGSGRSIVFKKQDDVPQAFSMDPLVTTLNWGLNDGTCYLPDKNEKGVFDLLFRFRSGEFVRLTPDGMQFWYQRNGRLARIVDKFPKNQHVLEYNERGELRKIIDRSVDSDRFLEIGYFRSMNASDMVPMLDEMATSDATVGKIARLRDYAGRDVTFEYSQKGFLDARHGIEITGAINGGFNGRATTHYNHDSVTGAVTGLVAGNGANSGGGAGGGTALFSTTTVTNADTGALVANSGSAVGSSSVTINVPVQNSAATAGSQTSSSGVADGGNSDMKFDDFRYPKEIKMTGPMAGTATTKPHFNDAGLLETIVYPEGNSTTYTYNLTNPVLRARPNVTHITMNPGTRGGNILNADFHYDERYNVMSGQVTDYNGKSNTYTVRGDGREIESIDYDGGGTQKYKHDDDTGQLMEETSPEGVKQSYGYENMTGFLMSITRGSLSPTMYSYGGDVPGKLGRPNTITPPRGDAWTSIQYDALLQMTAMSRGGMQENRAYDENGNIAFLSRTLGGNRTYSEDRVYGQNNFLKMVTVHNVEVNGAAQDLVTKFDPDPLFRVAKITYPDSDMKTRTFTYDHLGHIVSTTVGTYTEAHKRDLHGNLLELRTNGDLVRTMAYDGHDRLVLTTNKTGAGSDETTEVEYFPAGQLMRTTVKTGGMPDFERIVTDVDGLGRPLGDMVTGTNASRTITYQADAQGLTTTIIGPRDTTTIKADSAGRNVGFKNGLADVTIQPDDNNNVEHIISDEHGTTMFKQDFTFDGLDHVMTHSDGVGTRATFTPRFDGLATSVMDGMSHTTMFDYSNLGETISRTRPEQIAFTYQFDASRLPRKVLDTQMAGNQMDYDATFRRMKLTYRSGASLDYTKFDNRNQPIIGTMPGGNFTATYDLQGRLLSQQNTYTAGDNYQINNRTFDSLGRTHSVNYGKSAQHSATFGYDKLGPMTSADYNEPGGVFHVGADIYEDGSRKRTTYPSNTNVEDERQDSSRLNKVTVDGDVVWETTSFEGAELPGQTNRGVLRETNTYDARKRLLSRRFEKVSGGALVEDMRFTYDAANRLSARQFLGRGGRGDVFEYDNASRMTRAEIGARPSIASTVRNSTGLTGGSGLSAGFFARTYAYDSGGLDLLMSATPSNPSNLPPQAQPGNPPGPVVPEFMLSLGGHDSYLHATQLDNVSRGGTDAMGNVQSTTLIVRGAAAAEPEKLAATNIKYNALNHLTAITANGGTIEYEYQPTGLMHHKTVRQGGVVVSDHAFVWDEGRMIEERDLVSGDVVGRYYYADGDSPVAADLKDPVSGQVRRVQYLCDNVWSVIAVADHVTGDVLERVSYDAWGQPLIEARDTAAPHLAKIHAESNGDLLFQFSEPVLPAVSSGGGTGIVASAQSLGGLITITAGTTPVTGTIEYFEDAPGAPFGSVIRFRPNNGASGTANVQVAAAKVFDSWGNGNVAEPPVSIPLGTPGDVFTTPPGTADTSPRRKARSEIGNPFLFQGQYFDYDAGLCYMRARFYDPFTGQFLQRDPRQYSDSVNLYAALGSNPASVRDPTGTINPGDLEKIAEDLTKTLRKSGSLERELRVVRKAEREAIVAQREVRLGARVGALKKGAETVEHIPRSQVADAIRELDEAERLEKVADQFKALPPELRQKLNLEQTVQTGRTLRGLADESPNVDSVLHDINQVAKNDVRVLSQEEAVGLKLQNPETSGTRGFYAGNPGRGFIDEGGRPFVGIHDELVNQARMGEHVGLTFLEIPGGEPLMVTSGPAAEKLRRELVHEIAADVINRTGLRKLSMYQDPLEQILHTLSEP
jgi:RHS repeat-associated protein